MNLYEKYMEIYIGNAKQYQEGKISEHDAVKRLVYYGIKSSNLKPKEMELTQEKAQWNFDALQIILNGIEEITPREFTQLFPIDKRYDGAKYETKDYFYTMEMIEKRGMDKLIQNAAAFLWDYVNLDTSLFSIKILNAMDDLRMFQGKSSMIEEFFSKKGLSPVRKYQDNSGTEFLLDSKGRTVKLEDPKKKTTHLQLLQ